MPVVEINEAVYKAKICEQILRSLPAWFGIEESIQNYIKDIPAMVMFAAIQDKAPAGFLSLNFHNENNAEIHVMAVRQEFHHQELGRSLIARAEAYARNKNAKFLTVKTLSASRSNAEYDQTRKFYLAEGFLPLEEFKSLWSEGNPCLLMIKNL